MGTINDKLSVLATTTEAVGTEVEEKKEKNIAMVDFKMVTFSLGGKDYAIDIMKVKEIAKAGMFTYVPNILPFVLGVYNLRGDIIPIIDLRLFFNIDVPEREDNKMENMLIINVGEQTFGVVVDEIDRVVGIQKSSIQPPHPLFGDINIKYIYGVVEAEKRLYILLDIDKIFGAKTPEEEKAFMEMIEKQQEDRQKRVAEQEQIKTVEKVAATTVEKKEETKTAEAPKAEVKAAETKAAEAPKEEAKTDNSVNKEQDLKFIADSLRNLRKFNVDVVNKDWVEKRYDEWVAERGADKTQLQNEDDADDFLAPFYSKYTGTWWTEDYAEQIKAALPDNEAKNIVVWNPGCGKGYESYSLACILAKRYPNAKIKIYGHETDLLSVSNAPMMVLTDEASNDWYQPFTTKTVAGDYTFTKEIKDSIMFEYHDCLNSNNLPPIDIIFARDLLSFLASNAQKTVLTDFGEKLKGNGVVFVGDNENIEMSGLVKNMAGNVAVYSKQVK